MKNGFSTIELMVALTILSLVMTAVILLSFGSQSFLAGGQTNAEAMNIAQGLIEEEQALARKDFNLVNPVPESVEDIYKKYVSVKLKDDFLTKEVTATVKFTNERGVEEKVEITTLIANFDTPVGANTCDSTLSGDWSDLSVENSSITDFATLIDDPSGTYTIADIDAYKGKLYIAVNSATNLSASTILPTFFIFDSEKLVSDPTDALLGKIDNEGIILPGTTSSGINAVRVSEDPNTNNIYAYASNAYDANYTTCIPTSTTNCGQFEIFNVTDPESPQLKANLKLTSSPVINGGTHSTSIFYKNGYILLGLAASSGPEFHIIDVHKPEDLFGGAHTVSPVGSLEIGHDINALNLRGSYVYVSIPHDTTDKELQVINISHPNAPSNVGGFDLTGGGNGKSLYLVGNRLYFGNTVPSSGNDLHILDNTTPNSTLPEIGGTNLSTSLDGIIVRSNLAFLLTNTELEVYDIGDPTSTVPVTLGLPVATLPIASSSSVTEPGMDCEGNRIYVSSNDPSGKGSIYIIKPGS